MFCLNPFSLTWDCLTRLPAPRHHHGVARVNNILYVIGGDDVGKAKSRAITNGASKEVFAYDPVSLRVCERVLGALGSAHVRLFPTVIERFKLVIRA